MQEFLKHPHQIASIVSSSRFLEQCSPLSTALSSQKKLGASFWVKVAVG
jgi:hypothetical protein